MADQKEVVVDKSQVKKAVQALLAHQKSRISKDKLFKDDTMPINLLFTLWKIPKESQTIRIPLPHGQSDEMEDICLFTRDEPKMTSEQTERFYKKLLEVKGVKNISEIIPYNVLKTEYKPIEAKRRLTGNHDIFLADDRIRRRLPSLMGKHFYARNKEPLSVNLQSKTLARDIERLVQGTKLKVNSKGCCCTARIGHCGMTADELTENIESSIQAAATKIRMKGPVLKIVHVKTMKSVALPIYTADLGHMEVLLKTPEDVQREQEAAAKREERERKKNNKNKKATVSPVKDKEEKVEEKENEEEEVEEEEEIPQLVPITTPSKKPKLEKPSKKKKQQQQQQQQQLEKAPKSQVAKKGKKAANKLTKKPVKTDAKAKRKVPKVK